MFFIVFEAHMVGGGIVTLFFFLYTDLSFFFLLLIHVESQITFSKEDA